MTNNQLKEFLYSKLYIEVPESWTPIVKECIFEIYDLIIAKNMHPNNVQFLQIKEKYNQLRVYFALPILNGILRTNFSNPEPAILHNELSTKIENIVQKYDKIIQETIERPVGM